MLEINAGQARSKWFGHIVGKRTPRLKLPGKRPKGRAKRFMDILKEDMRVVGVSDEKAENMVDYSV